MIALCAKCFISFSLFNSYSANIISSLQTRNLNVSEFKYIVPFIQLVTGIVGLNPCLSDLRPCLCALKTDFRNYTRNSGDVFLEKYLYIIKVI